ncbi:MAG: endonuclease/exonuclease/phosphatase family protein [Rhodothermales bacterium]
MASKRQPIRQRIHDFTEGTPPSRGEVPYLALTRAQENGHGEAGPGRVFRVATYNVHRWAGIRGGRAWVPEKASAVIAELDAGVIALQEVLRPFDGSKPLEALAERFGFHLAFVCTRMHQRGELGNAILSRWPIVTACAVDLTFGRLEQRAAIAAQFRTSEGEGVFSIAATHLALVDRTRRRQVEALLEHPQLQGPVILLGDMNAWRRGAASRQLDEAFTTRHHNRDWPPSFPSMRPVLALDRAYARKARILSLRAHNSATSRRGSDHLPVIATVALEDQGE